MTYPLSATKLVTYKQCPQAYNFRYERGLKTLAAFGSADLGNALHQALASAYRDWHYNDHKPGWDWFEQCWEQCIAKLSAHQIQEGRNMMQQYYKTYVEPLAVMARPLGIEGRISAKVLFENIEFYITSRYDRLDYMGADLDLNDYKSGRFATVPDEIDVQLGVYYIGLYQTYRRSLKRLSLNFLRTGERLSFEVTDAHHEQVQKLISDLAIRLRSDREWEPQEGEHCKRCTYRKYCAAVCDQPEPLPEGGRKVRQVQLALGV